MSCCRRKDKYFRVIPYSQMFGCRPSTLKASKEGLINVGSRTDPYTSTSGEVMAARIAKRNTPERLDEIRQARTRRRQLIQQWSDCRLALTDHGDKDLRVLRCVTTIAALTDQKIAVHSQGVQIPGDYVKRTENIAPSH